MIAAERLASGAKPGRSRRFTGSRIGRAAAIARLLGSRGKPANSRARRAIVKARLVRLAGRGLGAAAAHLRYIQRDGVTRDGSASALYGRDGEGVDGKAFLDRAKGDRHQFRFILSAEDGARYEDLKPLTRRLLAQMEADLGSRLDWIAVDHRDTVHPHTHVMLRGKDERGENLVIAREYIARGLRERLAELVTLDLGPRTCLEIRIGQRKEVEAERLTGIDRALIRAAGPDRSVVASHRDPFQHALRTGRLRKLEALGLAKRLDGVRWRLAHELERRLFELGERGDIVRTMQRALHASGLERSPAERVIHRDGDPCRPIVGRVIGRGLADESADRHYLIVDGTDGRVHHIGIGAANSVEPIAEGSIVRLSPALRQARPADLTIAGIAAENGGRYGTAIHRRSDPSASEHYMRAHVRRLEAVRRAGGGVERLADGSWIVPPDYPERAAAVEREAARRRPVRLQLLSALPLERLAAAQAATWLDRELLSPAPEPLRDAGFGREVRAALSIRRQWLIDQGLAWEGPEGMSYSQNMIARLARRELRSAAALLADELGCSFLEATPGTRFEGRLAKRLDLASGRFAVVADSRQFILVPWNDPMERRLGRELGLRVGTSGIDWTLGRGRSGPER